MSEGVTVVADAVRAQLQRKGRDGRVVVAIDGPAGAGKTSVARGLAWELRGHEVATIHMDDLYDGWGGLDDALTAYLAEDLVPQIRRGGPVMHRVYDWAGARFGEDAVAPDSPVLVIEGVGSGQPVVADEADLVVWVEASPDVCAQRWLERDGQQMNEHLSQWVELQDTHFARHRTRQRADLIVVTD